jgi:catechol 2,3-dioxygenase-like lactoylglutathione lyase family enzyme
VSPPPRSVGAITMFVDDPRRSKTFYEGVFDLSPVYEDESAVAFQFENLIVNLLAAPAARELIDPASVAGAESGSRSQLTIWVDDVDAVCAGLARRGVTLLNGRWIVRGACGRRASPTPTGTSGRSLQSCPATSAGRPSRSSRRSPSPCGARSASTAARRTGRSCPRRSGLRDSDGGCRASACRRRP